MNTMKQRKIRAHLRSAHGLLEKNLNLKVAYFGYIT